MADPATAVPATNASAGHLYVRVEDSHAADIPFQFEQQGQRMGGAVVASFVSHAVLFVLALFAVRFGARSVATPAMLPFETNAHIIWLNEPDPGGGGGGGNRMQAPPRQAEELGKDKLTVPVAKPPKLENLIQAR